MTNRELVNLYELSTAEEQRDLAHELYKRVFRAVHGESLAPQQQPAQTQLL
jgi:chorismate mutase